ncbi:MAG: DNA recombination protein RmuC [Clostridiales Family XIII bacterium]|jgi:DNA recombination protein RmuC|nr:DNA recombination protein RmuC [Clostridiales Family XIII bacterium]
MDFLPTVTLVLLIISILLLIVVVIAISKLASRKTEENALRREDLDAITGAQRQATAELRQEFLTQTVAIRGEIADSNSKLRSELAENNTALRGELSENITKLRAEQADNSAALRSEVGTKLTDQAALSEQKLENIRKTMESRIEAMQVDNAAQLDKMRATVDEKLQKTLESRISESFKNVSDQLEQVYKGLGEMQSLATGVGDLKKLFGNVKSRGIMGEIQLGAILEDILSRDRYEENIPTKSGSSDRVEFAVKLPGQGSDPVYLPIDAKFPGDSYRNLVDAEESANPEAVATARKILSQTIKNEAKTIHEKYVSPPETTDFAILFLPTEGLYAEVVRMGLVDELQHLYKVSIAGPTTMAALLNSLQMGFRTLAIQKRSSEVWQVLGAVKTEFSKFEDVLDSYKKRIDKANEDLEKLIGTRTRLINSKLRSVEALPDEDAGAVLESSAGAVLSFEDSSVVDSSDDE